MVQKGDTLSVIIQRLYPGYGTREKRIYGPTGMLIKMMNLNAEITDPNLLTPGFLLKLIQVGPSIAKSEAAVPEVRAPAQSLPPVETVKPSPSVFSQSTEEESFSVTGYAGLRQLTTSQGGALGTGKLSGMLIEKGLLTELKVGDSIYAMNLRTFDYKYRALGSEDSLRMYSLNLKMVKGWFMGSLSSEQLPLFRNNGGNMEVVRENIYFLNMGFEKDQKLNFKKATDLRFSTSISLPVHASTDSNDVNLRSVYGYGANAGLRLNRMLLDKDSYKIKMYWSSDLQYLTLGQKTEWGVSKGNATSTYFGGSFGVGFTIEN